MPFEPPHPKISFVIPILNEEEVFPQLIARLRAVLDGIPGGPHEVLLIDDGSTDSTRKQIEALASQDGRFKGIHLSRNFGHQAAITAGLDHTTGDYVVTMDGDLQDPPEEVPRLLDVASQGYDVVYAQRVGRKENWILRIAYFSAYRLIAQLADIKIPLDSGDFGVMSKRVVKGLRRAGERQRFMRGLRAWQGFRQIGVPVERDARQAGRPKYTTRKLLSLAFDGVFAFSTAPLRFAALVGSLALAASSLYGIWAIVARLFLSQSPQGFTALITAIVFLAGVQLVFLGVIGEYIGRIYTEVKQRPHYLVEHLSERVGKPPVDSKENDHDS